MEGECSRGSLSHHFQRFDAITFFVNWVRPFMSTVGSGMDTWTSAALLLHLIHLLNDCTACTLCSSCAASSDDIIRDFSARPPGWYITKSFVRIPKALTDLVLTTSSFTICGNADISIPAARRSNLTHFANSKREFHPTPLRSGGRFASEHFPTTTTIQLGSSASNHLQIILDFLKMFGQSEKYSPKWWCFI